MRPPKRPPDEACLKRCARGKGNGRACSCRGRGDGDIDARSPPTVFVEADAAESGRGGAGEGGVEELEKGGGDGGEDKNGRSSTHHSLHMGVNDVATLVLEDNQGNTYDFYTFQAQ